MLGAIYGDIVGSRFELGQGEPEQGFVLFHSDCHITDDSLMTLAVAEALVVTRKDRSEYQDVLIRTMKKIGREYPNVSWGQTFRRWIDANYYYQGDSYGNGAVMRIAPVGWVCDTLEETIKLSRLTTEITHNHPEGIKGAESVAVAIFMARTCSSKEDIKQKMIEYYPELKDMTYLSLISSSYGLDETGQWVTCQGSVPQAICCFLDSDSLEDAVRKAVMLKADTDTQGCIAGAIAEAYYGFTYDDEDMVMKYIPEELQSICSAFRLIKKRKLN